MISHVKREKTKKVRQKEREIEREFHYGWPIQFSAKIERVERAMFLNTVNSLDGFEPKNKSLIIVGTFFHKVIYICISVLSRVAPSVDVGHGASFRASVSTYPSSVLPTVSVSLRVKHPRPVYEANSKHNILGDNHCPTNTQPMWKIITFFGWGTQLNHIK